MALERASGAWLGWFHLRPALDYRFAAEAGYETGDVDLGYPSGAVGMGEGVRHRGGRARVRRALIELDAARVVACALEANVASTRVLEKARLKRVGRFALPGYDGPAAKYALRRQEYRLDAG